jgi:hypothetical protein
LCLPAGLRSALCFSAHKYIWLLPASCSLSCFGAQHFWWQQSEPTAPTDTMSLPTSAPATATATTNHFQFPNPLLPSNPKPVDWEYFCRQFENYLLITNATDAQKLPLLLSSLGRDGLAIFDGLPDPKTQYSEAVDRFNAHFSGKTSVLLRRKRFYEARQEVNESISDFGCRLRRLARDCDLIRVEQRYSPS